MNDIVVDASVGVKWTLAGGGEQLVDEAFAVLDRYERGEIRIVVPDLFWVEVGNVLWKAVRAGRISKALGQEALATMMERNLPTVPSATLLEKAFEIATGYGRTVYDSVYVALARDSHAQLITADERLANALAAHFPVKLLGAV